MIAIILGLVVEEEELPEDVVFASQKTTPEFDSAAAEKIEAESAGEGTGKTGKGSGEDKKTKTSANKDAKSKKSGSNTKKRSSAKRSGKKPPGPPKEHK